MASLYFKTKWDSETGKKFLGLKDKITAANDAARNFAEMYGSDKITQYQFVIGGVTSLRFDVPPTDSAWRKRKNSNFYVPNLRLKYGKNLQKKMDALPTVAHSDYNACFGVKELLSKCGMRSTHPDWLLFEISTDFDYTPSTDHIEITYTEYHTLSGKEAEDA